MSRMEKHVYWIAVGNLMKLCLIVAILSSLGLDNVKSLVEMAWLEINDMICLTSYQLFSHAEQETLFCPIYCSC